MSDSGIIQNIGVTLEKLLNDGLKLIFTDKHISDFAKIIMSLKDIKDENDTDTPELKVYLFLYQVVENIYLKNEEPCRIDDTHLRQPPLVLDLLYLVIPYAKSPSDEQKTLAGIMQIFHDNAITNVLKKNPDTLEYIETDEEIKIVFNPMSLDDLSKFWTIFHDVDYKLAVGYIVTPVRIDSTREVRVQRVTYR
jgi:hypothetical protein